MGRKINRFLKSAVAIGGLVTAYQAAQTTKKEKGGFALDKFVGNFKSQAAENIRTVAGVAKPLVGKYFGLFTGKPGKTSAIEKNETFQKVYETAKAVAPEAVEKVEEYVEDVQKNAPEYQAQTEKAIDNAAESVIKYLDLEDEKEKEAEKPEKADEEPKKKAAKAEKADGEPKEKKAAKAEKADEEPKAKKAAKPEKADEEPKAKKPAKAKKADEEKE
ncbi:MAG: hypothetical protein K6G66_07660 [Oscillospiraceae bacterium]|nr:hypothetical protein [Oscillospiraceae bacterium]